MIGRRLVAMLSSAVIATLVVFAPRARGQDDWGGQKRPDGPDDRKARFAGRNVKRAPLQPRGEHPAPMQVSGGKLYIVTGSTVRKLDPETLEEEATAVIPVPPADAELETKRKEMFMERFDKDGDGFVREDEVVNPALVRRLDRDGDGAIGIGEVPSPQGVMAQAAAGPVSLLVSEQGDGGGLYVYRGGWIYRYDTRDLTLQAQNEIAPRRLPDRRPGRQVWKERRDRRRAKDNERDAPAPPPELPPELPDQPVRF